MKKLYLTLITMVIGLLAQAQSISVKSFQALPMDMTASSLEGKRMDQNGAAAALIKIVTSQTGFAFDGGALGIVDSKQMVGEVWVWVPYGSRKITISHQQLGVLRDYRYPIEIQSERTYEMVLTTAKIETIVKEEVREQYLVFQITPPDAMLEVDDQMWSVSPEGTARKLVDFGTYSYRVQALNYHPDAGRVTVDDPDNTQKVTVTLKPNFGWIEVPGGSALQGAAVYIDNTLIGKAPCKSEALKSGQHSVRILKDLYEPYIVTVIVNDDETTQLSPELTANFARVTLQVDADAEIWVNDEKKGIRTWTGNLESGTYKMECRMAGHESTTTRKEISNKTSDEVIQLEAPRPIYGSLNVESTPDFTQVFIDGKLIGETPKLIKEILIGQHELKLTKDGYADHTETITIKKGERKQVNATLTLVNVAHVAGNEQPSGESVSGSYEGHEYVDLGLPSGTLWATCNVGADSPEEYGDYFAWGETTTKSTYDWSTYKYCKGDKNKITKYCNNSSNGNNGFTDKLTVLQAKDDAATANWGSGWCMPTKSQWEELINNTTVTLTTQNGVNGMRFTASNGNSLFLPAAGDFEGSSLKFVGVIGHYWLNLLGSPLSGWGISFYKDYNMGGYYRDKGRSVRAVRSALKN